MKAADLRRWELQALDKLLGRLLNEASLARFDMFPLAGDEG